VWEDQSVERINRRPKPIRKLTFKTYRDNSHEDLIYLYHMKVNYEYGKTTLEWFDWEAQKHSEFTLKLELGQQIVAAKVDVSSNGLYTRGFSFLIYDFIDLF